MPIYEFYCNKCNTIFDFYSKRLNTEKIPFCPRCVDAKLERLMSQFSTVARRGEQKDADFPQFDEAKMGQAISMLSREAEGVSEDDPTQAADLIRKFTDISGVKMGPAMQEALERMESGQDPEQIEADMGETLNSDELFEIAGAKQLFTDNRRNNTTRRDKTLYEL
jgi:putative FmdB family regulatory protein